jgi:riboflavin synthase
MFTGLIEEVGRLHSVKTNEISILSKHIINDCKIGDSIAVNGICLTVTEKKIRQT